METVITRKWHGKTKIEYADEYLNYMVSTGIKDYQESRGLLVLKFGDEKKRIFAISGQ